MSQKAGISIRYKILLLLTSLPLIVLTVYLVVAIEVFRDDKLAYVFESSSSMAHSLSGLATSDMEGLIAGVKPALQELLSEGRFGVVSRGLFDSDGPIQWIGAFSLDSTGQLTQVDSVEKESGMIKRDWQDQLNALVSREAMNRRRFVLTPFGDERTLLVEKVDGSASQNVPSTLFVMMARMTSLAQAFQTPGQVENYLIDTQGRVLFGPQGNDKRSLVEKYPFKFLSSENRVRQGTEEIQNEIGETMLASYSGTNYAQLFAVSIVSKNAALAAVQTLIRKSIIFFAALICLTVIVSLLASSGLTAALTDLFQATKKVAEGHFDIRVPVKSRDEVGSLASSFNAMAEEVSRLMSETAEKARMESELKTAQTVQETLFPKSLAEIGGLQIAGFYEPASECGGDWWHYCEINGKTYIWIGDATGHGAPAALITSAAKSAATIIESLNVGPAEAMTLLNQAVFEVSRGRIMMTFFLGCYDAKTKVFTYSNASHEAPYLIKKSEAPVKRKDLIPLNEVNSPRLGQARDSKFDQTTVQLDAGDRILFYTDGIPEITAPNGNAWGEREFLKAIITSNNESKSSEESRNKLINQFQTYRQGTVLVDDITFVMAQVKDANA